ncbi:MAG TPA: hypothetical protein PKA27_00760 [Fimbriimonadaceae bacterium]|nr:hypothetical protein [Fimbriimonadaceae bacterium]
MIAALLALTSIQAVSASDYFPLQTGTKWTYRSESGGLSATQIDEVGTKIEIDGREATPIVTKVNGRTVGTSYYRVDGDTVYLIAEDPKKPLVDPQPVLKVGATKQDWSFGGQTSFMGAGATIDLKGTSSAPKARKVLDRQIESIEVRLDMKVATSEALGMNGRQTSVYAKGIGLVELQSEQTVGKQKSKSNLRLLKFESPTSP